MNEPILDTNQLLEEVRALFLDLLKHGSFYRTAIELDYHSDGEKIELNIKNYVGLIEKQIKQ